MQFNGHATGNVDGELEALAWCGGHVKHVLGYRVHVHTVHGVAGHLKHNWLPRYGLSLLPLVAGAAAHTLRTRRAMAVMVVLGALVLVPLVVATGWPTTRGGH